MISRTALLHGARFCVLVLALLLGSSEAMAQATRPPITIGVFLPFTGVNAAPAKEALEGLNLFLEQINKQVAGREVKLVVEDTQYKADVALDKVRKLLERDRVQILVGGIGSHEVLAVKDYVYKRNVPWLIMPAGGVDDFTQSARHPLVFRTSLTLAQPNQPMGKWLYDRGLRKTVLFGWDNVTGIVETGGFARVFTQHGGEIVQEIYAPVGTPDYAPFLAKIRRDADSVFVFFAGADSIRFLKQYAEFGLKGKIPIFGAFSINDAPVIEAAKDAAEGVTGAGWWWPEIDTPENKRFVSAFNAKYGYVPGWAGETAYTTAIAIAEGLKAVNGNIEEPQGFAKALEKIHLKNTQRGDFRFDEFHNVIWDLHIARTMVQGGKVQNKIVDVIRNVTQFWTWSPDEYMKLTPLTQMKGKWVKEDKR